MREKDLEDIRALPLFHDMSRDSFAELMRGAYHQTFPAQVTLIEEGATPDFLHVVTEGAVEMYARWQGRETTLGVARPVSTFILAASINDAPYLKSARTLVPSRIAMIPSVNLRAAFRSDAKFATAIVSELASCYRTVVRHAKTIKLRNSKERLAAFLLAEAENHGGKWRYELPFEKKVLASYLGMTPENLSRALRQLRDDGLDVDGTNVVINDPDRLRRVAPLDRLIDGTSGRH